MNVLLDFLVVILILSSYLIYYYKQNKQNKQNEFFRNINVWTRPKRFVNWENLVEQPSIKIYNINNFLSMFSSQPNNMKSYICYRKDFSTSNILLKNSDGNFDIFKNTTNSTVDNKQCIYGQGTIINGINSRGETLNLSNGILIPNGCQNTKIQLRNNTTLSLLSEIQLDNRVRDVKWIDFDPITNYLIVPKTFDNLNTLCVYRYIEQSQTLEYVRDISLDVPVRKCISGRFTANGHLYLLSADIIPKIKCYEFNVRQVDRQVENVILRQEFSIQKENDEQVKCLYIDSFRSYFMIFLTKNNNSAYVKQLKYSLGRLGSTNI